MEKFDEANKKRAETHEKRLMDYVVQMNFPAVRRQAAYWLVTHDVAPLVVRPSPEYGIPVIEVRDPMTFYPGTVWPHQPAITDVLFVENMTAFQAGSLYPQVANMIDVKDDLVDKVAIAEFFDGDGITVAMLEPGLRFLDFIPSPCPGRPNVIVTKGFSPDLDYHGQFDGVISALIAQAKLFAIVMAYASQQVASETVVVGEVTSNQGRWATGPGAVNTLTPMPGASATKLTNNMSVQVFNELDRLERAIRLGGQFPAQLSGEPVASIATGRGLEQLTLTVDDNVAYWQSVLDDACMRALGLVPVIAAKMGAPGWDDFSPDVVTYVRSLSGADPAESVRLLQYQGAKDLSRLTIMERLPEVDAPLKELERIDVDDMRQALIRSMDQLIGTQQIEADVVAEMIRRRKKGEQIEEIWLDIQKIQQERQQEKEQQMQEAQGAAGGSPGSPGGGAQGPPGLEQVLNPMLMAEQSRRQAIRQAGAGPEARQQQEALAPRPQPGAGVPGPAGVPA
jgi:hypothetical protein